MTHRFSPASMTSASGVEETRQAASRLGVEATRQEATPVEVAGRRCGKVVLASLAAPPLLRWHLPCRRWLPACPRSTPPQLLHRAVGPRRSVEERAAVGEE
uniref:Uncharacterized protein n=1 Tax=Arundo donax TaxID=35708 RepID=A0A0A9E814_ARUDO